MSAVPEVEVGYAEPAAAPPELRTDPRLLRSFVVLAEELHFGRTARRLHVAQPAVSQQIKRLELQLGVRLFARTRPRVALTEAGQAILPLAREAVAAAAAAEQVATTFARGERGQLRVGYVPDVQAVARAVLERLSVERPQVEADTRLCAPRVLLRAIAARELDVGLALAAPATPGVRVEPLFRTRAVVAVQAAHRLARSETLALSELRRETFALGDPGGAGGMGAVLGAACRSEGFEPRVVRHLEVSGVERAVREDGALGITTRLAAPVAPDIRLVPLQPALGVKIDMLTPGQPGAAETPLLGGFLEAARTLVPRTRPNGQPRRVQPPGGRID